VVGAQMRIEDERGGHLAVVQPIEEVVDQRCLTRSDLTGEQNKAFAVLNSVGQLIQRFLSLWT